MSANGQCPRGHDLEPNAVYCTVCWVRVEPEAPERVAARRRRQRRVWFPLFGAGAVVVGIAVGGTLGLGAGGDPGAIVAATEGVSDGSPTPVSTAAAAEPAAPEEPTTVAAPLAATVEEPTAVTTCLPEGTAAVIASTRADASAEWQEVEATTALGPQASCGTAEIEAVVTLAAPVPDGHRIRLVARDAEGERLARVKIPVE